MMSEIAFDQNYFAVQTKQRFADANTGISADVIPHLHVLDI